MFWQLKQRLESHVELGRFFTTFAVLTFLFHAPSKPFALLFGGPLGNLTTPSGTPSWNFLPSTGLEPGLPLGELAAMIKN